MEEPIPITKLAYDRAQLIQYIKEHQGPNPPEERYDLFRYLALLQWARSLGCAWNELTCAYAAAEGHLDALKWLRSSGCPWDENTCANAADNGQLEVLQWAHAQGCRSIFAM